MQVAFNIIKDETIIKDLIHETTAYFTSAGSDNNGIFYYKCGV